MSFASIDAKIAMDWSRAVQMRWMKFGTFVWNELPLAKVGTRGSAAVTNGSAAPSSVAVGPVSMLSPTVYRFWLLLIDHVPLSKPDVCEKLITHAVVSATPCTACFAFA